jgi:NADPH:quinone reductase-like Zn-dependent oxidoreductase
MDHVREHDRVLILGGSGGVGAAAIQLARYHAKASFGAHLVIYYRTQNWWEMLQEFGSREQPPQKFDVITDTVGGGNYHETKSHRILKCRREGGKMRGRGGRSSQTECSDRVDRTQVHGKSSIVSSLCGYHWTLPQRSQIHPAHAL